jgi:hypothetical protein
MFYPGWTKGFGFPIARKTSTTQAVNNFSAFVVGKSQKQGMSHIRQENYLTTQVTVVKLKLFGNRG